MDNRGRSTRSSRTPLGSGSGLRWFLGFLAVALLVAVVPLRGAAPAKGWGLPGLVAAYGFDEGAGATTTDESGFGNTGAIAGATWTTDGRYGGALSFDGVNDWVTIPGSASLDLTTGMTLSAWVKPRVLIGKYRQVILKETTGGLVYGLYANTTRNEPQGSVFLNGRIRSVAGSTLLPVDTWTNLAITFDNNVIRLYINGVQVDSLGKSGPITLSTGALRIGGNSIFSEWFDGLIDEVRVYNRALSPSDLLVDMNTSVTPPPADTQAPTAPSGLSASASPGTVNLNWTGSTDNVGVDHYNVYRGTTAGFTPSTSNRIALVGGTTYADSSLGPYKYYYRVTAEDAAGNVSSPSNEANATVPDTTAPTVPGSLSAVGGPASASLSWSAATDDVAVHHYNVYRGTSSGFTPSAANRIAQPTGTSFGDSGLATGTYYYRVTAEDAAGNVGAASAQASAVVPDTTAPTAPTGLGGTGSIGTASLSWTGSTDDIGVDHYNVYRSTVAGFLAGPGNLIGQASGTTYDDIGVPPGVYFYKVDAEDAAGNLSAASADASVQVQADTSAPTAPQGLGAVVAGSAIDLSWQASTDNVAVHHYDVHRGTSPGFTPTAANRIAQPTTTGYADQNLAAGTYYYVVIAVDGAGNSSGPSAQASGVVTDTTPPTAPSNLAAVRNGSSVDLSWDASTDDVGVARYNVFRGTSPGFTPDAGNRIAQPTGTSYSDPGLGAGTYYYVVAAEDAAGNLGPGSNAASATIPDTQAPGAPSGLSALGGPGTVSLSWSAATDDVGVHHYNVYRSTVASFIPGPANRIGQASGTSYLDEGLATGVYFYKVDAQDAAGNVGAPSNQASATVPDTTAPTAPGNLAAVVAGHDAQLSWTASSDNVAVHHYNVHRGTTAGFTPSAANRIAQPTGTSYTDLSRPPGTFYYRVTAEDAAGNVGPASSEANAVIPDTAAPTAPTGLNANVVSTSVNLGWTASTDDVGVTGYSVHRGTTSGFTPSPANRVGQPAGPSFTDSTAPPGTYYYVVTARDAAGNVSAASNQVSATIEPPPPPPPGLVAAYGFDEGSGTTVADSSGTGNAGAVAGATWSASGRFGGALSFDGVDDIVTVPDSNSLDLTSGMTIEAWVKPSVVSAWRTVIFKEQTANLTYGLYANRNTNVANAQVFTSSVKNANGTTILPVDAWTHLAATYDGDLVKLFVNGALAGQGGASGPIVTSNGVLHIGGNAVWGERFQGLIDEIRIYNRAISQTELDNDINRSIGVPDTTVPTDPTNFVKTASTATSISTSWGASTDNVGIAGYDLFRNGALVGSTTGTSFSFSPLACNTSFNLGVQARDYAGNRSAMVPLTTSTAACDTTSPATAVTAPVGGATVTDTITVTGNATDNDSVVGVQFKLDGLNLGAEDTTAPYSVSWNTRTSPNGTHTLTAVGRDPSGNLGTSAGVNVNVSNVPIDPSGLVASYGFEAGSGSTAVDSSGQGNTGSISGAAWAPVGRFGHGLSFDGQDDMVTIQNSGSIDLTAGMTLEAWVRPTALGTAYRTVLLKEQPNNLVYGLYANRNTGITSAQAWIGGKNRTANGTALPMNTWSHIAASYDGGTLRTYTNGVETGSFGVSGSILSSNGLLRIGGNSIWGEYFQGVIDEARVYNRALSPAEIQSDMIRSVATDNQVPTVAGKSPANGAQDVNPFDSVTVTFSEAMNPATITGTTFELRNAAGTLVPATISYDSTTGTATLAPASRLAYDTVFTAKVKGGAGGVKDMAGNALAADNSWTFTSAGAPSPIVVLGSSSNPFSSYATEMLKAEGFNLFDSKDIASVNAAILGEYDVAILGNISLTSAQVTMLTNYVNAGGNLIAFRPDKQLAGLMGLTDATSTLSNAYLKIDTGSVPGAGIVSDSIQFHGTADRYTLNGATTKATLYSDANTATANPALTMRSVGANGGQAAAFTYDLARSVVYTRQGNPAWAGQDRDGIVPIRPNDLFFGNAVGDPQPDWVDTTKMAIPQADEQQRLLANLVLEMDKDRKPLPRYWYFPREGKAVVVMTGDDHAVGGTAGRWDQYIADSPPGCSVALWQCVRGTSYLYPGSPLTDAQAVAYEAQGFEVAFHGNNGGGCSNWTVNTLTSRLTTQLAAWTASYPSVPPPTTHRLHCVAWSDWASLPKIELGFGWRLDTNYYHYPETWIGPIPGFMTGSGMPMRFADLDGSLIDVYQAHTFWPDESGQQFPFSSDTVLDRAVGASGYYGWFMANMHTDNVTSFGSNAVIQSAQTRGVPVITARQMLNWTDGRDRSSFASIVWSGNTLTFKVRPDSAALGLDVMLPIQSKSGALSSLKRGTTNVPYTTQTIKGISYAVFPAVDAAHTATYGP